MVDNRKSNSFTQIIRKLLMIFLVFTFIIAGGSYILRHTINLKLNRLSGQLSNPGYQPKISKLLFDLNLSENSFRQASSNGNESELIAYKQQLDSIFSKMGVIINHYKPNDNNDNSQSKAQIAYALQQKLKVSQQLFDLQKRFTFLLNRTNVNTIRDYASNPSATIAADTAVSVRKESAKSGLIERLKDAVQNKSKVKVVTIRTQQEQNRVNAEDPASVKQLGQQYGRLMHSNQELILANLSLLTQLRQVLLDLQAIDRMAFEQSREKILDEYKSTSRDLNIYTAVATAFVLLFIILLLIYIRKAALAERRYIRENLRAVRLAGQRSEILAIMSHEIRNKLMAINGAVFMLKRTQLKEDQENKVTSINLASSLLLETVNNVLDVSKFEQNPDEANLSIFSPYEAISDSVEAMRFMAERKNLELNFKFEGNDIIQVQGDSLRLKQILINLLSNAIKYTDKGSIDLYAKIQQENNLPLLSVVVKDTGLGISKSKQGKLFTQFYQAGGKKPGTGLGLYLCRQLINQQGGSIALESDEGEGCTVSFFIPYK
ncbi:HAMP domain-containing sensor histidine kinase [Pedobacter aquatilis]|uniref:sensor histidine kinase n=1 Tax=Pedobacter aquatilis TaxID=351343 RepID=UPI0025B42075|nr:HAMP domain-containing sensor histidine kinase [Pedobacter aquatilis]MDN3587598.1 HAMP domain-containing sensor histidine kinase [Pedobacter aquatilis]